MLNEREGHEAYGSMLLRPFAGILTSRLRALVPPFDTIKNVRAGRFATLPQNERTVGFS